MKAQFEKVPHSSDSSWQLLVRRLDEIPFEWHFHPEFELTLTLNSAGKRYIGDSITEYQDYDLVLLGPNIPHTWQSRSSLDTSIEQRVYVLWFDMSWLESVMAVLPECQPLKELLLAAKRGLSFPRELARELLGLFEDLEEATPTVRLANLLQILERLNRCSDASPILVENSPHGFDSDKRQQRLLSQILEYIHANYLNEINLSDLAGSMSMSNSTLARLFKKSMGMSINGYITQVRIAKSCSLLIQTDKSVALISEMSGFRNLSNFNRLFLKYKGLTPRQFRSRFMQT